MRALSCVLCLLGCLCVGGVSGQTPETTRPDGPTVPLHQEPHHRQLFQHGAVRILELQLPPGDKSWFHSHDHPVLYVTLANSQMRTQNLGQDWGGGGRGRAQGAGRGPAAGGTQPAAPVTPSGPAAPSGPRATSTTSYAQQSVTHRIENVGTTLIRNMIVVNEGPGDETTSEQAAGFEGKPELSNRWFRAYRIVLEPGAATAAHTHRAPVAIIQATNGNAVALGAATWEFNQPGQWGFFETKAGHEIKNVGDTRIELIEVEVRTK
jgi:hypothetical protein